MFLEMLLRRDTGSSEDIFSSAKQLAYSYSPHQPHLLGCPELFMQLIEWVLWGGISLSYQICSYLINH